ncbi:hypothetical protein K2173_008910 [Erythroxylum novogranatense]|uniref:Uncharacterized protein n=1 Tax=Erythroxylum novogranatense TaxID=1862640 RepID=A0AAV8S4J5_9ROSI|nr:hypothetical protein K2173_008910 [Erythroxylum novogranatense]
MLEDEQLEESKGESLDTEIGVELDESSRANGAATPEDPGRTCLTEGVIATGGEVSDVVLWCDGELVVGGSGELSDGIWKLGGRMLVLSISVGSSGGSCTIAAGEEYDVGSWSVKGILSRKALGGDVSHT